MRIHNKKNNKVKLTTSTTSSLFLPLSFLLFLTNCAPHANSKSSLKLSQNSSQQSSIVGGVNTTLDEQKQFGVVGLLMVEKEVDPQTGKPVIDPKTGKPVIQQSICTGTLIHKRLVLTAAHCIASPNILRVIAFFSPDMQNATRSDIVIAANLDFHADFLKDITNDDKVDSKSWNDIGMILLEADAPADFKIVTLSQQPIETLKSQNLTLVGYGVTNAIVNKPIFTKEGKLQGVIPLPSEGSGTLRKVEVPVVGFVASDEIIVDGTKKGACHGDSGGPAFMTGADGTVIQVGVTSRGTEQFGNCIENAIYTAVSAQAAWIKSTEQALLKSATTIP